MPTSNTMSWSQSMYVFFTGMVIWGLILESLHIAG